MAPYMKQIHASALLYTQEKDSLIPVCLNETYESWEVFYEAIQDYLDSGYTLVKIIAKNF